MFELRAGNQRVNADAVIGFDFRERLKFISERKDLMPARLKHATHDQSRGAARIN